MIYLDNAATTAIKPPQVAQAVYDAINSGIGNASRGTHGGALKADNILFQTREKLAEIFNAPDPSNIVFSLNITESLNIAIKGLVPENSAVITTVLEHNSVLRPLYQMRDRQNVELRFVSADKNSRINYEDFEKLMSPEVKVIVCTQASNLTGYHIDIKRVGEIAKKHGVKFIVDSAQSAGLLPIDVQDMNIDILCFTGHKGLYGPQGTGGMVVGQGLEIYPLLSGGTGVQSYNQYMPDELPEHLEAGTQNMHGLAGLSSALDYLKEKGIANLYAEESALARKFYEGVKDIDGVKLYGDYEQKDRAPIVTLNVRDYDSSEVSDVLSRKYSIATRPGAHCAPLAHEALGTVEQGAVRFSFSSFNTEEDVAAAIKAIKEIASPE